MKLMKKLKEEGKDESYIVGYYVGGRDYRDDVIELINEPNPSETIKAFKFWLKMKLMTLW